MKFMTPGEAETKRHQAVEFLRRIGNDDSADKFDDMSAEEYAEHKGVELMENPGRERKGIMPQAKSKAELEDELEDANDYIEQLEGKLNDIVGIAADEDEDEDSTDEGDDEEEEDDELD